MARFRKTWLLMAILAGIVIWGMAASPAQAQFRLRVEDVGQGVGTIITDQGPGDINPVVGAITFSGPVGTNFIVNVTTGISMPPVPGGIGYAELDLNSVNVASAGAGTLRITLVQGDDPTAPGTGGYTTGPVGTLGLLATIGGTLTAPAGSTLTAQSWANPTNAVIPLGLDQAVGPIGAIGPVPAGSVSAFPPFVTGPGAFSATGVAAFTRGTGPYSLFSQVTVSFSGSGSVSFDENQLVIPAPGGLVLALTGLPVLGLGYLRRRLKAKAA